jgi:hypothetical protein
MKYIANITVIILTTGVFISILFKHHKIEDNFLDSPLLKNVENSNFLKSVIVNNISYQNDNLTPDIMNGKLFGDTNITKQKHYTHFFVFHENKELDQRATKPILIKPDFLLVQENYKNKNARIKQIMSFKKIPKIRPPKPKKKKIRKKVATKKVEEEDDDLSLPEGLLPPKLPRIPLYIDIPVFPNF